MTPSRKPLRSVLIKPAGPDCNMACTYCFYSRKAELFNTPSHRMPDEILKILTEQVMTQSDGHIGFIWQGGEPTLMGLPFFEKAVAYQREFGGDQTVGNALQTNGLLIDESWAWFLARYRFLVGLSIDGPEAIHDHYRKQKSGSGTRRKVGTALKVLQDAGVAVNALTVVNDHTVKFPEAIYTHHKQNSLTYMQFIPCVEPDPADPSRPAPYSLNPDQYGLFLRRLFDLWLADFKDDTPTTSIRFFDALFYAYVDQQPPECTLRRTCGDYVVVEHTGDVYACDFFVSPEWRLGNLRKDPILDMLNSPLQHRFGQMKADLPDACRSCQWLNHCRGGCPKDRRVHPQGRENFGLNHLCLSFRIFFNHADATLKRMAAKWKKQHGKDAV